MNPKLQTTEDFAKAVRGALEALRKRRPIFHSEGDFQHEFANDLADQGLSRIRVEWPFKIGGSKNEQNKWGDIVADGVAIELKHKAGAHMLEFEGEKFSSTRSTDANVVDRREFWEDVWRIDQLVNSSNNKFLCGFAILLTNRNKFWEKAHNASEPFAHNGSEVKEFFHEKKGEREHRTLSRVRTVHWQDWSNLETKTGKGVFRCAIVEIRP